MSFTKILISILVLGIGLYLLKWSFDYPCHEIQGFPEGIDDGTRQLIEMSSKMNCMLTEFRVVVASIIGTVFIGVGASQFLKGIFEEVK